MRNELWTAATGRAPALAGVQRLARGKPVCIRGRLCRQSSHSAKNPFAGSAGEVASLPDGDVLGSDTQQGAPARGGQSVFVGSRAAGRNPSATTRTEKAKNVKDVSQSVNSKQVATRQAHQRRFSPVVCIRPSGRISRPQPAGKPVKRPLTPQAEYRGHQTTGCSRGLQT